MRVLGVLLLVGGMAACGRPEAGRLDTPAIGNEESRVVAEVLNAAGSPPRSGLARVGTRTLRAAGIDVVYFGTADTAVDTTLVLVRRGDQKAGHRVAGALGVAAVKIVPDSLRRVDVTVLLGRTWTPPRHPRP